MHVSTQVTSNEASAFTLGDTLAVYGIEKNPFPIEETDDFFFSTRALGKGLDAVRNLVEYSDLLLVVSGVEGSGKTTFLNHFLSASENRWKCCRIDAQPSMSIESLVEDMLSGFGVKVRGDDTMGDEALLRAYLANVHADEEVALVAIDDAHLLPQICTEFLLGLAEKRGEFELRLLLTTEPGRLGFSTSDSKRVHVVVLEPFDVQQCADYLNSRLSHAGLVGDSPFSSSVVEEIYQDSGGVPGAMHPAALHTLLASSQSSVARRRSPVRSRPIAYAAVVLAVGAGIAFMLRPDPGFDNVAVNDAGTTGKVRGLVTSSDQSPAGTGVAQTRDMQSAASTPGATATTLPESHLKSQTTPSTAIVTVKSDEGVKVTALDETRAAATETVAVGSRSQVKGGLVAEGPEPVIALADNVTPELAASPEKGSLDWLREQNPTHFVIQLVGTRDAAAARKFLDSHKLGDKGTWLATSHENKPWYVVVYGMYPDSATARAAIKSLPEPLRAGSPWPRSVASVIESAR